MNRRYFNLYTNFLENQANLRRSLRVVLDCSNGPAGLVLRKLKIPKAKFVVLNSKIDDRFPAHGPNPLAARATNQAAKEVRRRKADLAVVFDADADRAIFVDNRGRRLPSYAITLLLSLVQKPPFVADIYVFGSLRYSNLLRKGVYPSKVGTLNIKNEMYRRQASFGAEYSGHFYFRDFFYTDSGILATIKVMNALSQLPHSLADFYDSLPEFHSEQFNVRVKNIRKLMDKIEKTYRRHALKTDHLDGYSFNFRDFLVIVRLSNTESLIRFFVGAKRKSVFRREMSNLKLVIQKIQKNPKNWKNSKNRIMR
ncbi:MAG: Phosphomannomutase [Candidatus Jorgensenbacteria bacterium GW2011_GWA1_48_11]|uniref:Phosphomannomutase n=1 Tax=Candidatus Jorgensenbacteria bacterium GW2011_GWA1_48_11 TaxID=1618660 RepID=A0A0G1XBF4_9BACT|nr:MAG: Phosphomannomutase [Candidatus Jorgensenbacteria bacterium GW2011_GWA1_48_11]KKW12117.1 MAG: Phosphomannomutase [Candidatus Jorgensenbacteria bacterium GW2011_GWB1_49_9]